MAGYSYVGLTLKGLPAGGWSAGIFRRAGAGGVVPGPSRSVVVGVVRSPALTPRRSPGGSVASPGRGGRARRGRVAPGPTPWHAQRLRPCVGAGYGVWWRWSGPPAAPGTPRGHRAARSSCRAWRCQALSIVVPGAVSAAISHGLPGMVASSGPGGWRQSVTGKAGCPRRASATQQGLAGDGKQRPLVPHSRCSPRLMPSVRLKRGGHGNVRTGQVASMRTSLRIPALLVSLALPPRR